MNGTTQAAHQKLVGAIESALPGILMEAVATETAPLKAEAESLRLLVNKSGEDLNLANIKAAELVQQKQDIIAGLQSEIAATKKEIDAANVNLAANATALNNALAELESLKATSAPQAPAQ